MIQDAEVEPPMIRRAKAYIGRRYGDPVDLEEDRARNACKHLLFLQDV